jgi:hypothetical protein
VPLPHYGVLIGTLTGFYRDPPNNEGKYLHGHVQVNTGHEVIDCAVDCNHATANVDYLSLKGLDQTKLQGVQTLSAGFHALASNATSGALDYVRNPLISIPLGCAAIFWALFDRFFGGHHEVWKLNVGDAAVAELEAMVNGMPAVTKVIVFGDRWSNPNQSPSWGMHDIHFNQGDPPGQFQPLDGVWQDGGVIVQRADGSYDAFLVKFTTQTMNTNDATGLPN